MRISSLLFAVTAAALTLSACAPARPLYVKPGTSRDNLAIDALDCNKAGIIARRDYLARRPNTPETIQAANAVARAAIDRCARSRGYKRVR